MSLALALWARDAGLPQPKVIAPVSPMLDLSEADEEMRELLAPSDPMIGSLLGDVVEYWAPGFSDLAKWEPSPAYADLTGIAPIHVFAGGREVLMPDAFILKQNAKEQGMDVQVHVYEGTWHCAGTMLGTPESDRIREDMFEILFG